MYIFVHICNMYTIYDYIHVTVSLYILYRVFCVDSIRCVKLARVGLVELLRQAPCRGV